MNPQIDPSYVTKTLKNLIRINSINPRLSPDGQGEAEIGAYVAEALHNLGLQVTTYEIEPGRVNVVGILKGTGGGKALLLNAHMDTVGVEGMLGDPFGAEIREGRLYGRGAQDMKGSLAAMLGAAKALAEADVQFTGDVIVTGVADEEHASIGMDDLVKHVSAEAAIVTEPTDLTLCRAHRGFIWYDVETFGRAAHGSRFQEGIDANMRMGRFLAQLDVLEQELRQRPPHPLVGPPSLHAARLQGGSEVSIYAAHCLLQIERRTTPGESEAQATAELQEIIDQLQAQDVTFRATVTPAFQRNPFEIPESAPIVRHLAQAMRKYTGTEPRHTGQTFWTDAAILADAGFETVLIGPVGGGLHSAEEWVDLQSVHDLAQILADTALSYCQTAEISANTF
ncbi:MAG TPA: acetylornithine deacetylase [Chloroflexi bacterium]|nr:acetylornithine deacetylase [Chloroflexota bacterium]HBY09225.1 acetylornithine deacetylase [Chloroflexota bacterium]